MSLYRDTGVVLRTYKLGEADRIVVLMTAEHGKVRAVAKGVRKTKSRFGGRLEPLSHVSLLLYQGRELDVVSQAESIDHFRVLHDDLSRLTRGIALLEAVDQLAQEREPNLRLYQMLLGALRALAGHSGPLVVPGFFLKALALEGFRAVTDRRIECNRTDVELVAFDLDSGGTRCADHRVGTAISPEALALLDDILNGRLGQALNEPPSPATTEVELLARRSMEHHLERRLRSVTIF